jgi:hypothetical protein
LNDSNVQATNGSQITYYNPFQDATARGGIGGGYDYSISYVSHVVPDVLNLAPGYLT